MVQNYHFLSPLLRRLRRFVGAVPLGRIGFSGKWLGVARLLLESLTRRHTHFAPIYSQYEWWLFFDSEDLSVAYELVFVRCCFSFNLRKLSLSPSGPDFSY